MKDFIKIIIGGMNMNSPILFTDIDGVLATSRQYNSNPKKWNTEYGAYKFDEKCVVVFNKIITITNPLIVISSDWRLDYNIKTFNRIFEINKVQAKIFDYTPNLWGTKFRKLIELEECRANEIIEYTRNRDIEKFIAFDDLNLSPWLPNNFIHIPNANEGIKQSGIFDKIINKINELK